VGYLLGLDTGGTFTDAVLLDDELEVLETAKSLTTHGNLIDGLCGAVDQVIGNVRAEEIQLVCLSTTLATNALVEGRSRAVALLMIGYSPAQLRRANLVDALGGDPHIFIRGGHSASGQPLAELDIAACRDFVDNVNARVDAFAVSGVFAVRNPEHEVAVQNLIKSMTGKPVSCGHHLSTDLDAPRRALTALLNARLIPMINALLDAAGKLLRDRCIDAPLMVVKGDGSLVGIGYASQYPVETILSGPAASVVGAQFLCKQPQLLVSDMGGTTTDIALLRHGQPLLNEDGATVGGWRTMVKAVDVRTFGLGGDSAVAFDTQKRAFTIGPQRVIPLSLLLNQYPDILETLEYQLSLPFSTTHTAQFVLRHTENSTALTPQQRELLDQIGEQPVALQTLFADQTLERALLKLEHKGLVIRSGFTPTDASHLLAAEDTWDNRAADLGARLLMRYAKDNLGKVYTSIEEFSASISLQVSEMTAMILLEAAASQATSDCPLSVSQLDLIRQSFQKHKTSGNTEKRLLSISTTLHTPIAALGAPAGSYYPAVADLLNTTVIQSEYASVANAVGAVVGVIRQEIVIEIQAAGGKQVRVLFAEGPQDYATLEAGALAATTRCTQLVREKAVQAGAVDPAIRTQRVDNAVRQGNETVFFDSRITAIAVGRPAYE
jgi:N-methylhydantoinase A/oxoprolinase/acetone carboxylase beta subunit